MIFNKQELVIPSRLEKLNEVVRLVEGISNDLNINHTYFGNILVAVTEAVKNAIIHGNQGDPARLVTITCEPGPTGISFSVKDEGAGFDPSATPDPTEAEEADSASAPKGLYLIRSLAEDVKFLENGSLVRFTFSISSINYELSMNRAKALHAYFQPAEKKVGQDLN